MTYRKHGIALALGTGLAMVAIPLSATAQAGTSRPTAAARVSVTARQSGSAGTMRLEDSRSSRPKAESACSPSGNWWVFLSGTHYEFCWWGPATADAAGYGPFGILATSVPNRIWLEGPGWADCFEGRNIEWQLHARDENPAEVGVSTNTAPC